MYSSVNQLCSLEEKKTSCPNLNSEEGNLFGESSSTLRPESHCNDGEEAVGVEVKEFPTGAAAKRYRFVEVVASIAIRQSSNRPSNEPFNTTTAAINL